MRTPVGRTFVRTPHSAASNPTTTRVDPPGIEPGLPACHTDVIPLDHRPILRSVESRGVAPRSPVCKTGILLLDDEPISVTEVGVEPTLHRLSTCRLYRLAYPVIELRSLGLEPRNQAYETR